MPVTLQTLLTEASATSALVSSWSCLLSILVGMILATLLAESDFDNMHIAEEPYAILIL